VGFSLFTGLHNAWRNRPERLRAGCPATRGATFCARPPHDTGWRPAMCCAWPSAWRMAPASTWWWPGRPLPRPGRLNRLGAVPVGAPHRCDWLEITHHRACLSRGADPPLRTGFGAGFDAVGRAVAPARTFPGLLAAGSGNANPAIIRGRAIRLINRCLPPKILLISVRMSFICFGSLASIPVP